ncbi:tyrosine-type recombinase/integrase [Vibrio sp. ZSDE26]|uniref:Tyrosine-type recombinase/integrase n=1 Tax=Vibrio amylolyticus TaxID=2847292 RepID=A0A9X1XKP8_9VIBR|nr:tyrosine-type recombinase/integrase [Vibrio amylolyticus]MCK6263673.1 tyrosine-type recombinase/integrase [Vibrio amylolyticus]
MPKQTRRLTDKEIANTIIRDKEYTLSDGDGLNLRIRPNGTKSWQFRYSDPVTKRINKITLGTYPSLKLSDARKQTQIHRNTIASGINLKKQLSLIKQEEMKKEVNNLYHIADLWFQRKEKMVSHEHAKRTWRTLEKYIFPKLGHLPIQDINRPNTILVLRPIEKAHKLSTIKRLCQSLNQIMEYGVDIGAIDANPLTRIINAFDRHNVEHMPTVRPELLGELLYRIESNDNLTIKTKCLLLWQLHTITRPREAARTRWCDIDLIDKTWSIPKSEMKSRREHRVPLTRYAIDILEQVQPFSHGKEFVFSGERNNETHMSTFTANAALKRSLGMKGKLVAHGLRSIASTALHEQGFDTLIVEACLAHSDQNETRASYNRTDFFVQRIDVMHWWSEYIEASRKNLV